MGLGYSLLRAYVAEHIQLLLVFSTHTFFLSGCAVETRAFRGTASASNRVFPQPARGYGCRNSGDPRGRGAGCFLLVWTGKTRIGSICHRRSGGADRAGVSTGRSFSSATA